MMNRLPGTVLIVSKTFCFVNVDAGIIVYLHITDLCSISSAKAFQLIRKAQQG